MSKKSVNFCEECEEPRKNGVNHWIVVLGDPETPEFMKFDEAEARDPEKDVPTEKRKTQRFDYCGSECATKCYQRWLGNGSIIRPETKTVVAEGKKG